LHEFDLSNEFLNQTACKLQLVLGFLIQTCCIIDTEIGYLQS